jgi:hypothetical protein
MLTVSTDNQVMAQLNNNASNAGATNNTISSIIENNYADLVLVDYDGSNIRWLKILVQAE